VRSYPLFPHHPKRNSGITHVEALRLNRDLNTRFSGIHPEEYAARAVLPLESVQRALARLIDADTILIGHALDNDLRALRLVHRRVVDTAALFPHNRGPPYRRALRDL
jgi:RNA exonuclease 1